MFIGIVIGVLAGGRFTMHKIHRANNMRSEHGFVSEVSRLLDLSPSQAESILPIIEDYAKQNKIRHERLRSQEQQAHENLRADLEAFLSEDELRKLRRLFRHKGPKRPGRKNHPKRK